MLTLYNTISRSKEIFTPITKGQASIFSCGPSIYRRPHIGNYRTFLYEDLLIRYLQYLGYKVKHTTILTDIEDKSIIEAKKKNKKIHDLTGNIAKQFFNDAQKLGIKLPDPVPRASTAIEQMVYLINKLLNSGHAYRYKGDIFFDPLKFKDFGKLFKLDMSRWPDKKRRFKKDTYPGRRWNLGDFILWHGINKEEKDIAAWNTAIGKGRPSWNIQDPAIITKHLDFSIDINCGGIDNLYRHHDYNIAIIESISEKTYANYYLHGEHLIVNGKSMSKSRGNILYPSDIFKKKYYPYHLRFFLLYKHYRQKLNFTHEKFKKSSKYLDSIRSLAADLINKEKIQKKKGENITYEIQSLKSGFENHMNDDLGFGPAIDNLFTNLRKIKTVKDNENIDIKSINSLEKILKDIDSFSGILF
jgi:cysteinyl-tRNA synthetase